MEWEQRRKCDQNTQFNGETISVWNIDGMSEHQVFETLHKMLMVVGAYESSGCPDHKATRNLITGFAGSLRLWREHCLSP